MNLFTWHKNNEEGLWLDDGMHDIDAVRKLQSHPWITVDWSDDEESESEKSEKGTADKNKIQDWIEGVQSLKRSGRQQIIGAKDIDEDMVEYGSLVTDLPLDP